MKEQKLMLNQTAKFCSWEDNREYRGRPLYTNHEAIFFMDKIGGGEFVHIFAKSVLADFDNTFSVLN